MSVDKENSLPTMSIILVTPTRFDIVARTVRHLQAQTVAAQLELVLVAPSREELNLPAGWEAKSGLHSVSVVEYGPMDTLTRARVAGVRAAHAPIVAIGEDHSFPRPGWAEALLQRYEKGSYGAVGPAMANANPGPASWAQIFMTYSRWVHPTEGGEMDDLPGHNGSYQRHLLLEYGDRLEEMMEAESVLHHDLRARGHALYLEPTAITDHIQITRFRSFVDDQLLIGRLWSAQGSLGKPFPRRLVSALAAPLLTPLRVHWALREVIKPARRPFYSVPSLLPRIVLGSTLRGFAEFQGHLFGPGSAVTNTRWWIEFEREKHLEEPLPPLLEPHG